MKRAVVIMALLGVGLVSLTQFASHGQRAENAHVQANCPAADSNTYYFPSGTFGFTRSGFVTDRIGYDEFKRNWYSRHLVRMQEPSLSCGIVLADVSYRVLWLATWGPLITVRINRIGDKVQLEAVELLRAGGYEPGAIKRRQSKILTAVEWARIESALDASQFWIAPTTIERTGADGAQWVVEGRRSQAYHVVDRWSPEQGDAFLKLGSLFVEFAGWSDSTGLVH